jgi:hypothetical protein
MNKMLYNEMYESIYYNKELENEVSLDMSYFWYSDVIGKDGESHIVNLDVEG